MATPPRSLRRGIDLRVRGCELSEAPGLGHSQASLTVLPKIELLRGATGAIIRPELSGAGRYRPYPAANYKKRQTMKFTDVKMLPYDAEFRNPVSVKFETDDRHPRICHAVARLRHRRTAPRSSAVSAPPLQ